MAVQRLGYDSWEKEYDMPEKKMAGSLGKAIATFIKWVVLIAAIWFVFRLITV